MPEEDSVEAELKYVIESTLSGVACTFALMAAVGQRYKYWGVLVLMTGISCAFFILTSPFGAGWTVHNAVTSFVLPWSILCCVVPEWCVKKAPEWWAKLKRKFA